MKRPVVGEYGPGNAGAGRGQNSVPENPAGWYSFTRTPFVNGKASPLNPNPSPPKRGRGKKIPLPHRLASPALPRYNPFVLGIISFGCLSDGAAGAGGMGGVVVGGRGRGARPAGRLGRLSPRSPRLAGGTRKARRVLLPAAVLVRQERRRRRRPR